MKKRSNGFPARSVTDNEPAGLSCIPPGRRILIGVSGVKNADRTLPVTQFVRLPSAARHTHLPGSTRPDRVENTALLVVIPWTTSLKPILKGPAGGPTTSPPGFVVVGRIRSNANTVRFDRQPCERI